MTTLNQTLSAQLGLKISTPISHRSPFGVAGNWALDLNQFNEAGPVSIAANSTYTLPSTVNQILIIEGPTAGVTVTLTRNAQSITVALSKMMVISSNFTSVVINNTNGFQVNVRAMWS